MFRYSIQNIVDDLKKELSVATDENEIIKLKRLIKSYEKDIEKDLKERSC